MRPGTEDCRRRLQLVLAAPSLLVASFIASLVVGGCSARPDLELGGGCDLTNECRAPYVCSLGACRQECRENRDCRAGLICLRDEAGFGACQLEAETECVHPSDCPAGLVCRFGKCSNECVDDRDCPNGLACREESAGQAACQDPTTEQCRRHSDCPEPFICARDLRCREQCRETRDCRDGRTCDVDASPRVCVEDLEPPLSRPLPSPTAVSGGRASCALEAGALVCHGDNAGGLVGAGVMDLLLAPTEVLAAPVGFFAVGGQHACAFSDQLYCWGEGANGEVGEPVPPTTIQWDPRPVADAPAGVRGLALGAHHTCIFTDTAVHCWGLNDHGQLGDGSLAAASVPGSTLDVGGPVVQAAAGDLHSCVVRDDGRVFCWGRNDSGEVGDGSTTPRTTPTMAAVDRVVGVVSGRAHTCALREDRTVRCWGDNGQGQLGIGTDVGSADPVAPVGLGPVVSLTAGQEHTCVIEEGGVVRCFGRASSGQLGSDVPFPMWSGTPLEVPLPLAAVEVRAGVDFTCTRLTDDSTFCFGDNSSWQFGDMGPSGSTPRLVTP